jgi:hypothetical protein
VSGRTIFRVLAAVALVGLLALVGVSVYNSGVSAGLGEAARLATASGDPVPVYAYPGPYVGHGWGYGWGGFGFFGIFFWIIGLFLVFGLIRAAFWGGRWGGPRNGSRSGHLEEWHRRAHDSGSDHAAG